MRPSRAAFERKIQILEEWVAAANAPPGAPELRTLADFREWSDVDLGASAWVTFSIDAPGGPNRDLRRRLDSVLPRYRRLVAGEGDAARRHDRHHQEARALKIERDNLVTQNVQLLAELEATKRELSMARIERDRARAAAAELTAKVAKIVPIGGGRP